MANNHNGGDIWGDPSSDRGHHPDISEKVWAMIGRWTCFTHNPALFLASSTFVILIGSFLMALVAAFYDTHTAYPLNISTRVLTPSVHAGEFIKISIPKLEGGNIQFCRANTERFLVAGDKNLLQVYPIGPSANAASIFGQHNIVLNVFIPDAIPAGEYQYTSRTYYSCGWVSSLSILVRYQDSTGGRVVVLPPNQPVPKT